jgi:hypothetical protein
MLTVTHLADYHERREQMRNSKHGLKAFVLAIMAALGMMAFAAGGAQAQNPEPLASPATNSAGTYLINLGAALLANIDGTGGLGSLLVPGRNLKIECHEAHLEEAKIHSSTDALGKVTFLGCVSLDLTTGAALPCETKVLKTISATALALPILHGPESNRESFVLFEPQGENFTVVTYKEGTECPLPLNNPVKGSIAGLVDDLETVKQLILFNPDIQLLTGDKLSFGGFPSYIHADVTVELTPPHEGQKLGIH